MNIIELRLAEIAYNDMMLLIEKEEEDYYPGIDLKIWNNKQKDLWLGFVSKGLVARNDFTKCFAFATKFRAFWDEFKKFPTIEEAEKFLPI